MRLNSVDNSLKLKVSEAAPRFLLCLALVPSFGVEPPHADPLRKESRVTAASSIVVCEGR